MLLLDWKVVIGLPDGSKCGTGRRWGRDGGLGLKQATTDFTTTGTSVAVHQQQQLVQVALPPEEQLNTSATYTYVNDRMRSPTRVEVDSSVYLESPVESPRQRRDPQQLNNNTSRIQVPSSNYKFSILKYFLLIVLTNSVIFVIKRKVQGDGVEEILVFLGVCNVGLAVLYMVTPVLYVASSWTWSALTKRTDNAVVLSPIGRLESASVSATAAVAVQQPLSPQIPSLEVTAPPPPYHIAVNASTPPPSYYSIFAK